MRSPDEIRYRSCYQHTKIILETEWPVYKLKQKHQCFPVLFSFSLTSKIKCPVPKLQSSFTLSTATSVTVSLWVRFLNDFWTTTDRYQWLRPSRPVLKQLAGKLLYYSLSFSHNSRIVSVDHLLNFRVAETLGPEILTLIKAPPKPGYPLAKVDDLALYDAFIFGIPTRFGNMPAQWKVQNCCHSAYLHNWFHFSRRFGTLPVLCGSMVHS